MNGLIPDAVLGGVSAQHANADTGWDQNKDRKQESSAEGHGHCCSPEINSLTLKKAQPGEDGLGLFPDPPAYFLEAAISIYFVEKLSCFPSSLYPMVGGALSFSSTSIFWQVATTVSIVFLYESLVKRAVPFSGVS